MTMTATAAARPTSDRHAALAAATARIRARRGPAVPVEQILLGGAAVLIPLGLVFVMLGWDGAAHNGHTYAQISYLISGGIFGLGLSVLGCFMYFGYWLSRQLAESRRQSAATQQSLKRIEELLEAGVNLAGTPPTPGRALRLGSQSEPAAPPARNGAARPPRRRTTSGGATAATDATGELPAPVLLATPKGTLLHRPDCPVVASRPDLRPVRPGTEGFGYCSMCDSAGALA